LAEEQSERLTVEMTTLSVGLRMIDTLKTLKENGNFNL
jgi:hypothetical protein